MKTATVRELRNRYTQLLEWIDAGEEVRITRRGIVIARLVPENRARAHPGVDWTRSAALMTTLHLGTSEFLTFDTNQRKLATVVGLKPGP